MTLIDLTNVRGLAVLDPQAGAAGTPSPSRTAGDAQRPPSDPAGQPQTDRQERAHG